MHRRFVKYISTFIQNNNLVSFPPFQIRRSTVDFASIGISESTIKLKISYPTFIMYFVSVADPLFKDVTKIHYDIYVINTQCSNADTCDMYRCRSQRDLVLF